MITTYFSGKISRVFLQDFLACLSVIEGSLYIPVLESSKNEVQKYLLLKNMFEPTSIHLTIKKEIKHNDGHSDGFEIEVLDFIDCVYNKEIFKELKETCKVLGGSSYCITTDYDDTKEEMSFCDYNLISNYSNAYTHYVGRYSYFEDFKNESSLSKLYEQLYNVGPFLPESNKEFENFMDKVIDAQIDKSYNEYLKEWNEPVAKTFPKCKKETYFGYKTNLYFFRYFLFNKYNCNTVDDCKKIKAKDVKEYISLLKTCFPTENIFKRYTAGIMQFLYSIMDKKELDKLKS